MRALRAVLSLAALALLLASCSSPRELKYQLYVFGTLLDVVIYDADKAVADQAVAGISARFQEMHRDWHPWKPGLLTDLNAAFREGRSLQVDRELIALIEDGRKYEQLSGGLFNPAIGALIGLWGFHADDKPTGPPPARDKIAELAAAHPSMTDIDIRDGVVSSRNKRVQIDTGAYAKGAALDWASAYLKAHEISNAILNAGGGIAVVGRHGARPWKVAIRHPLNWGVIASLDLGPDEAMHTSGNYHRFREHEGLRYSHIFDPRTGWPVDHIVSASVVDKNGGLADAAATALSVAGPDHWLQTARAMGVSEVLLVDKDGGIHTTPKMQKRIKLEAADARIVEVKDPLAP